MGIKGQFVTALMALAIARASAGRGMPRGLILVGAAIFLLIVIPFTIAYRAEVRTSSADLSPRAAVAAAPAVAGSAASTASAGTIPESVSYLAQRLQEIDASAIVLQKTPSQIPYAGSAQIPETLAAGLIPRALWPGKPIMAAGYQFSQEYYGTPPGLVTAAAITPQADLYRDGGWVTMVAGMLVLGWLMRVLDDVLDAAGVPSCRAAGAAAMAGSGDPRGYLHGHPARAAGSGSHLARRHGRDFPPRRVIAAFHPPPPCWYLAGQGR